MYTLMKQLSRKYLFWLSATVPVVGGWALYMKHQMNHGMVSSLTNTEYIYLPAETHDILNLTKYKKNNDNDELLQVTDMTNVPDVTQDPETPFPFSSIHSFSKELEALKLSQQSDFWTSINLARTANVNLKSFRPPLQTEKLLLRLQDDIHHMELEELMCHLLRCALKTSNQLSDCAKYLAEQALVLFESNTELADIFFAATESSHRETPDQAALIKRYQGLYLQAILENIFSSKENALNLLNNGLLVLLHKLRQLFPDSQLHWWIASCISALSEHPETHQHFYHTGWIGLLAQWLAQSNNIRLELESAKALFNMSHQCKLGRSLYILHPLYDSNESITINNSKCDIILIHGLQGGVFKTWRQSDTMKHMADYTECWPKSWLAEDFPKCRILALNYQTFLSNWNITCGQDEYNLKERSSQLAEELRLANVGKRPIVWIAHSMGGLLVKQMLTQIDHSDECDPNRNLLEQTKGMVFYSVPHKGSEMAVWSPHMQRIISPTNHVLELRTDSAILIELHQQFVEMVKSRQLECLSFSETKPCTLLRTPIQYNFMLVPPESADPGVGQFVLLEEDHFNICKPKDKDSDSYKQVADFISKVVTNTDTSSSIEEMQKQLLLLPFCVF